MYRLAVYEGRRNVLKLLRYADNFAHLCNHNRPPDEGVTKGFILDTFKGAEDAPFAFVAFDGGDRPLGFVVCIAGFNDKNIPRIPKVVFVEMICVGVQYKGLGKILMKEVETYARHAGADGIVLHAIPSASTIRFYTAGGYRRGIGERTANSVAEARKEYRILLASRENNNNNAHYNKYLSFMGNEYYPEENELNDTMVFYKLFGNNGSNKTKPSGKIIWNTLKINKPRSQLKHTGRVMLH